MSSIRRTVGYGATYGGSEPPTRVYLPDDVLVKTPFTANEEPSTLETISPYACEFVGTFLLALTFGYCSIFATTEWGPLAIGSALMVLVYSMGPVSGANLNPAVSLAMGFLGKLRWKQVLLYMIVQIIAGLLAGLMIFFLFNEKVPIHPSDSYALVATAFCEIFYTFVLVLVVLNCSASERNNPKFDTNQFYGLAIGFVIVAAGHAAGPVSGAVLNPALAIGFAVFQHGSGFLFVGFQVAGAGLAVLIFKVIRPEDARLADDVAMLETFKPSMESRGLSEFVGTFVLVATVSLNIITHSPATAWSAGAALMCMIYSFGDVSGAHFNPAVTLAVCLCGRAKCRPKESALYACLQVLSGIVAGFVMSFIHCEGPHASENYGIAPQTSYKWIQVAIVEVIFTFLLCYVVLSTATVSLAHPGCPTPPKKNFYFALAIGMCVTIAGFAVGTVSGGIINPAVAVGLQVEMSSAVATTNSTQDIIAIVNTTKDGEFPISVEHFTPDLINFLWFALFEIFGGGLAAIVFHSTHAHEFYAKNDMRE